MIFIYQVLGLLISIPLSKFTLMVMGVDDDIFVLMISIGYLYCMAFTLMGHGRMKEELLNECRIDQSSRTVTRRN
jgi:hypothetical protein